MSYRPTTGRERAAGAALALLSLALVGAAIIAGLAVRLSGATAQQALATFDLVPPTPPAPLPDTQPPRQRTKRAEGAAAPPNVHSKATEVQAPTPVVEPTPPPIPAATKAATGSDVTSGNADIAGPGSGAGGEGQGSGSGRAGDGPGGGGANIPPHRIGGRLSIRDLPDEVIANARQGELRVGVLYRVLPSGRVDDCQVEHSSGNRAIDSITCALIEKRFRYAPSRTPSGRPVASYIEENQTWVIDDLMQGR